MSLTLGRRRGRSIVAGAATLGLAASILAVTSTSANAIVDPPQLWVNNPNLAASCGLDVVLVLDAGTSVATSGATADVKASATALVDAFKDTNSRVGITSFASNTILNQGLVYDTADSAASTGALGAAIAAYTPSSVRGTNWEAGIKAATAQFDTAGTRAGVQQLMIVVTDGTPNQYFSDAAGTVVVNGSNYPSASSDAMTAAMDRANVFKQNGGRMLGIGVGSNFSSGIATTLISYLEHLSQYAVQLTAGPPPTFAPVGQTAGPNGVNNPTTGNPYSAFNPTTTDTLIQPDYAALATQFRAIADNVCDSTLSLVHQATRPTAPKTFYNGGSGWQSNALLASAGPDWVNPVADTSGTLDNEDNTSNAGGVAVYQWYDAAPGWTRSVTVTLTQKTDYTLSTVQCRTKPKNGSWSGWGDKTLTGNTFTVTVGGGQVQCLTRSTYTGTPQASISITPRSVTKVYGATGITLSGKATRPVCTSTCTNVALAGKSLTVQRSTAGGAWSSFATVKTTSTGAWALAVKPAYNTSYRVYYAGMTGVLANYSATAVERVATKVTNAVSANNVKPGTYVTFSTAVAPGKAGQTVTLQRYVGSKWVTVTTRTLSSTSKATYRFRTSTTSHADYKYRWVKPADAKNYTGVSAVITLVVK